MPNQLANSKPKRHWYQYSLRTLLLFVFVCAIPCSWLGVKLKRARDQREAVEGIFKFRGYVFYEYETDAAGNRVSGKTPPEWNWVYRLLGTDFSRVTGATVENDKQMAYLEALPDVENLSIVGDVSDDGLAHVRGLSRLRRLQMYGPRITDAGLAHLEDLNKLQILQIQRASVTIAGLVHLQNLTELEELDLPGVPVRKDGETVDPAVKYISKLTKLRDLPYPVLHSDAELQQIAAMTRLEHLLLRGNGITDAGLAHIAKFDQLRQLNLEGTEVTDAGLANIKGLTKLSLLDLKGSKITDAGLKNLEGLTKLSSLDLSGSQITDSGLEHLKHLTNLQYLQLNKTAVSGPGLEHLKVLIGLQNLDLSGTKVTDAGLEHVKDLKELRDLNLSDTDISDAGLQHLKGLIFLARLNWKGTKITQAGLMELKRTAPNLETMREKQERSWMPFQ